MGVIEGLILGTGAVLVGQARHSIMLESCRVKTPPFTGAVFLYKGKYYYHDLYVEKYMEAHKDSKLKNLKNLEADYLQSCTDPLEDNAEYQRATLDAIQATIRLLDGTPEDIPPYEWKDASTIFASSGQPTETIQPDERTPLTAALPPSSTAESTSTPHLQSQGAEQRTALQAKLAYVGDQLTTLELRMASRFDGEPTEDGIVAALQQNLITKEQAEQARERVHRNTVLQEQDEAERDSLIQQAAVLQAELNKFTPLSTQQALPSPPSTKKSPLTIIFGLASVVLLIAVIALSVQLSNAKNAPSCLAVNANNYIRELSEGLELAINSPDSRELRYWRLGAATRLPLFEAAYQTALENATQTSKLNSIPPNSFPASVLGETYHRANCPLLKEIPFPNLVFFQTETEAKAAGFDGCPTCVK